MGCPLKIRESFELNAGDKDDSTDSKEVAMAALHNTKYCIRLDHPILMNQGVFYPKDLSHPLKFEITIENSQNVKLLVYNFTSASLIDLIVHNEGQVTCFKVEMYPVSPNDSRDS